MTADSDLLRKVEGLLKKAEGTDNEHEAAAFFAKAQELMLRHSIDEMQVRARLAQAGKVEEPVLVEFMYSTSDANAVGKAALLNMVAKSAGVKMLNYHNQRYSNLHREGNNGVASQWCALVGFPSDIENVKLMYVSLIIQDRQFAGQAWREMTHGRKVKGESKFRTGHLHGFASRVGERLREKAGEVQQATSSTALVVVRDQQVADKFQELFPRTKTTHHRIDFAGSLAGRASGNRADIGNARVGAGRMALGTGR
jgi:hypothetical protein